MSQHKINYLLIKRLNVEADYLILHHHSYEIKNMPYLINSLFNFKCYVCFVKISFSKVY